MTYVIVPNDKTSKCDGKGTKCLFLGNCQDTNAYKLMFVDTKKIIESQNVVFMEDGTNIGNDLEMHKK